VETARSRCQLASGVWQRSILVPELTMALCS